MVRSRSFADFATHRCTALSKVGSQGRDAVAAKSATTKTAETSLMFPKQTSGQSLRVDYPASPPRLIQDHHRSRAVQPNSLPPKSEYLSASAEVVASEIGTRDPFPNSLKRGTNFLLAAQICSKIASNVSQFPPSTTSGLPTTQVQTIGRVGERRRIASLI